MEGRKREMPGSFFFALCLGQSLFIKLAGGEFLLSSLFHSIRWALERIFDPFAFLFTLATCLLVIGQLLFLFISSRWWVGHVAT
jgi:hypothetical protein